ncbi:SCP2 sterol-binding domain-containing protein [Arthrobacter sp. I2-34]|uniref:SCP2 sterol-binding domain-containing protein n=1 Tax=Arthrobacter hankyongi TaxID=2904801 RepID=A0ABS9L200_9MICC|nr:SCP2 sterol-binding domain-containing protein [Arthrobacter hankyongi]MCG2620672.1 SCP2 sterol-binding domain-containing protein [Arthrobacter hankyongi]
MIDSAARNPSTDGTAATFFEDLGRRGSEPLLRKVSGRIRFDLVDGAATESWHLTVDQGELTVARGSAPADCIIRGERSVFQELVGGRRNLMAAVLRGAVVCHGDLELLLAIQRIFPAPPPGWDPAAGTRSA